MQDPIVSGRPLVSVVIATYNMGNYVCEAVRSVLAQTYTPVEVIVIDDGSKDDTWERLLEFKENPDVLCVRSANQGQPRAKNEGLKRCRGQLIAFCDADDIYEPFKIESQVCEFERDADLGVLYTDTSLIDSEGNNLASAYAFNEKFNADGRVTEQLIIRNFVPFGTAMFRRECMDRLGIFDEQLPMGIDWDLWLRYSLEYKFRHIPLKTYKYRIWPGQMSRNYRGRYVNAERIMEKFFAANPSVVPESVIRIAWSDTYANKAVAIATGDDSAWEALICAFKALHKSPLYPRAWWALAKVIQLRFTHGLWRRSL